jgi:hypothetical protein
MNCSNARISFDAGFQDLADWALSQADRIDPVLSGSFKTVKTTIEAGRRRLILRGGGGWCVASSDAGESP